MSDKDILHEIKNEVSMELVGMLFDEQLWSQTDKNIIEEIAKRYAAAELAAANKRIEELETHVQALEALVKVLTKERNAKTAESEAYAKCIHQKNEELRKLESERKQMVWLLTVARCPQCDNKGTITYVSDGSEVITEPCQWCDEKKSLLTQSPKPE